MFSKIRFCQANNIFTEKQEEGGQPGFWHWVKSQVSCLGREYWLM